MDMCRMRKCGDCGAPSLEPISREMGIYSTIIHYKCAECGGEIDLTPMASIGVVSAVGTLAVAFWGYILFSDVNPAGPIALAAFAFFVAALAFITIVPALAHLRNSAIESSPEVELPIETRGKHVAQKPIIWIERFGYIAGLMAPILLIAGVLLIATIIGYINFTYFGN